MAIENSKWELETSRGKEVIIGGKVARDTAGINRQERVRPDKNEGAVSRVLTTLTKRRQP